MRNFTVTIGAVFGGVSVAMGAFGAHVLRTVLTPYAFSLFQLSAHYMLLHAIVIVVVGLLYDKYPTPTLRHIATCFSAGIVFFSGALLTIALTGITIFGAVAPIGGILLMIGWGWLAWVGYRGISSRT